MDGNEFVEKRHDYDHRRGEYSTQFYYHDKGNSAFLVASVSHDDGCAPVITITGNLGAAIMRAPNVMEGCNRTMGIMAAIDQAADFYWTCKQEYEGVSNEPQ